MIKKMEIEIFGDADYRGTDNDDIAHAIATIEVLKPYVRVMNRGRSLHLPDSHPHGKIDTKRLLIAHDTEYAIFNTGRSFLKRSADDNEDTRTVGMYLADQHLCVVSTDSPNMGITAKHEIGHAFYTYPGSISETADDMDHCSDIFCIMHEITYDAVDMEVQRIISPNVSSKTRRSMGARAQEFVSVPLVQEDFCMSCEDALDESVSLYSIIRNYPDAYQNYM